MAYIMSRQNPVIKTKEMSIEKKTLYLSKLIQIIDAFVFVLYAYSVDSYCIKF